MKNIICLFGVLCLLTISGQFTDEAVAARSCSQYIGVDDDFKYNQCIQWQAKEKSGVRKCSQWIGYKDGFNHNHCIEAQAKERSGVRKCSQWIGHSSNYHEKCILAQKKDRKQKEQH